MMYSYKQINWEREAMSNYENEARERRGGAAAYRKGSSRK